MQRLTGMWYLAPVLAALASVPLSGQAPPEGAKAKTPRATKAWSPPMTRDGQPDLQGVWLNNSATPLERPKELEGRPFLTDQEIADLKRRAARLFNDANSDFAPGDNTFLAALRNIDQYKNPNATGDSREMIEMEFERRTSLIVDPPDGAIPPLTP